MEHFVINEVTTMMHLQSCSVAATKAWLGARTEEPFVDERELELASRVSILSTFVRKRQQKTDLTNTIGKKLRFCFRIVYPAPHISDTFAVQPLSALTFYIFRLGEIDHLLIVLIGLIQDALVPHNGHSDLIVIEHLRKAGENEAEKINAIKQSVVLWYQRLRSITKLYSPCDFRVYYDSFVELIMRSMVANSGVEKGHVLMECMVRKEGDGNSQKR
eukprot:scaffold38028_cov191-Amphora_coffeaeformis.AAC.2